MFLCLSLLTLLPDRHTPQKCQSPRGGNFHCHFLSIRSPPVLALVLVASCLDCCGNYPSSLSFCLPNFFWFSSFTVLLWFYHSLLQTSSHFCFLKYECKLLLICIQSPMFAVLYISVQISQGPNRKPMTISPIPMHAFRFDFSVLRSPRLFLLKCPSSSFFTLKSCTQTPPPL